MKQLQYYLFTFTSLCIGMLILGTIASFFKLVPNYAYYFVWQSTFVFLGIAIVLSIYFDKSKLFVLLLFPLFFNLCLAFPTTLFTKLSVVAFWSIVPAVTAIGYLIIYSLQERGIFSAFGAVRFGIGVGILTIGFFALKFFTPEMQKALSSAILHKSLSVAKANDFSVIIAFVSLSFIFLISKLFNTQSQKAPFFMLLAQLIALLFFQEKNSYILFSLIASLIAIAALVHDSYRMAYKDTLTGLSNRRALEEKFMRLGSNYIIAMVDIDFFKKFNDTFGHDIGDEVLRLVAKEISHVKNGGNAYRYGGEEFTILFVNKKKEDCIMALEEVRERIFRRGFVVRSKERPQKPPKKGQKAPSVKKERLSVSIGVATSSKGLVPADIIKLADEALYKAKQSGRNCLISA